MAQHASRIFDEGAVDYSCMHRGLTAGDDVGNTGTSSRASCLDRGLFHQQLPFAMFEITPTTCKASHTETNVKVRVKVFPLPHFSQISCASIQCAKSLCELIVREIADSWARPCLRGANSMSMLCLWLTYVSGQTQDLMVSRDVLHRRQRNDNQERP